MTLVHVCALHVPSIEEISSLQLDSSQNLKVSTKWCFKTPGQGVVHYYYQKACNTQKARVEESHPLTKSLTKTSKKLLWAGKMRQLEFIFFQALNTQAHKQFVNVELSNLTSHYLIIPFCVAFLHCMTHHHHLDQVGKSHQLGNTPTTYKYKLKSKNYSLRQFLNSSFNKDP